MDLDGPLRTTADLSSVAIILGAIAGYLPAVAAFLSIIYYCILIYKSKVVQRWLRKRRLKASQKRRAAKLLSGRQQTPS